MTPISAALRDLASAVRFSYRKVPQLTDEEVWMRTFTAVASCDNSTGETARNWADKAVLEFRKRFPHSNA